jgi:PatG Domain
MQGEPGTSTDSQESSERPIKPAANPNGGEALSRPALDTSDNGGSIMPAPLTRGDTVATPAYMYAIGQIEPRFPTLSAEKEFAQATGRAETAGLSDRRALQAVLSQQENRYLVR